MNEHSNLKESCHRRSRTKHLRGANNFARILSKDGPNTLCYIGASQRFSNCIMFFQNEIKYFCPKIRHKIFLPPYAFLGKIWACSIPEISDSSKFYFSWGNCLLCAPTSYGYKSRNQVFIKANFKVILLKHTYAKQCFSKYFW